MDYPNKVSYPRMFRWFAGKSNTNIKETDLFNPPDEAIRLLQIVPTEEESVMTSYITLGHVDTIVDPTVELIKKELAGATAIRRAVRQGQPNIEVLYDQPTKADLGASFGGVVGVGGKHADTATTHDDDLVDAQERINIFENTPFHPYTEGPIKKVDIYAKLGTKERRDLRQAKNAKPGAPDYPRPSFPPSQDFKTMTNMRMPYEDKWKIQLTYRKAYDSVHRIIDLDFCKRLKDRYDQLNGEALSLGVGLDFLVPTLVLDEEEMIKYVKGESPNPHGKSWTKGKRIFVVISMNDMHYWTVEILLKEGMINVYDSNVPLVDDFDLFLLVESLMVLLPILLRKSKLMNHFPKEVLMKKSWDFEGQNKGMILLKDDATKASGSHALAHIEYLLIGIEMTEPTTFLYDNAMENLREVWAYGVLTGRLKPMYIKELVK
ncbi:hypothetical protein P3S68_025739 [Capsicum galapagoense]